MTTGELLSSHSSVSNVSALTHLQNITGGGGVDKYIPYTDINVEFFEPTLEVNFEEPNVVVDFTEENIIVDFTDDKFEVTFDPYNLDINITQE